MREDCAQCLTKAITCRWVPCWRRNLTYVATCFRCKEENKVAENHGESAKSLYARAKSHLEKLKGWDPSNFMLRHNLECHPEEDPLCRYYLWEPTGCYKTPIQREIAGAIKIKEAIAKEKEGYMVLNAKTGVSS